MKVSYRWLQQYLPITQNAEALAALLTDTGLEVEGVETFLPVEGGLEGLVIGQVVTCGKHPGADKLSVTTVDAGQGEPLPIVCGAPNVAAGQKVVVATVGTTLYPTEGDPFKIKKSKIRGEASQGMICAEDEIGLGTSHDGIMVLDTDLPNGTPAATYFNLEPDQVIEIGLTPNRSDATSHYGVCRDIGAVLRQRPALPSVAAFAVHNNKLPITITVADAAACPRYCGVSLTNVKVQPSPDWLKQRLMAIGLQPINNIVDITNYVLHETGQPLHAFDAAKIGQQAIRVKQLPAGTPFVTLDGKERKLAGTDLMICDGNDAPLCIAGVFGGEGSGVTEQTTAVFLECAYFDAGHVRKTAQHHGLKTDASFRYERGTDPEMPLYALRRAALLMQELAEAEVSSEVTDLYPEPVPQPRVPVLYRHVNRLIGKELDKVLIHEILDYLEINAEDRTDEGFTAVVPTYRVDVLREADVIEEVLRIYGYNQVELDAHFGASYLADFAEPNPDKVRARVAEMLAANGYYEVMTNSLTNPAYVANSPDLDAAQNVVILNKLSEELEVMRQSLLHNGLEVLAHNLNRKQKDLALFEFGKVYQKAEAGYPEEERLAIWLTGLREPESWLGTAEPVTFYDLSYTIEKVFGRLQLAGVTQAEAQSGIFDYGLTYSNRQGVLGHAGQLSQATLKQFGIQVPVFYAEVHWSTAFNAMATLARTEGISKYPEVKRDLSLVLDKHISYGQVEAVVKSKEFARIVKDTAVFDVYEGDKLEAGKKAYALSFKLQDADKTLTDKAIDKTMSRLIKAFETTLGAHIRQ